RAPGARVILGVQNTHPAPIPPGAIALNPMGEEILAAIPEPIGPFASRAVDVAELLPGLAWPRQIEPRGSARGAPALRDRLGGTPPHRPCQCRARRSEAQSRAAQPRGGARQGLPA